SGSTARTARNTLFTLMSTTRSHSSGSPGDVPGDIASCIGEQNVDLTEAIDCRLDHGRDIGGFCKANGRIKGSDPTSPPNAFNRSADRATSASLAPSAANRLATAPLRELAPVTIIVLFLRLPSILNLLALARRST